MSSAHIRHGQLFGTLALILGFAIWSPTGKLDEFPKYWWDEAFTVEIARTFNELGVFDLTVAPSTPSGIAIALNANGFPLSLPLAMLFRFTDVSVVAARIMMLGWMLAFVGTSYWLFSRYLGHWNTLAGLLLVGSFAPFYANGRTATGDIPGLLFFVLALYAFTRERFLLTGVLTALALVTKTSSFHIAPVAVGMAMLFVYGRKSFRPLALYILGGASIALLWLWLLLPSFSWESLAPAIQFFQNPTHKSSLLSLGLAHPSLLLTQALMLVLGLGALTVFTLRKNPPFPRSLSVTLLCYGVLQTLVYVRSPGWSRYLLPVEFFLLLLLPVVLQRLALVRAPQFPRKITSLTLLAIISLFSLHYQFASDIFPRASRSEASQIIMAELAKDPASTIGFIDDPVTASFIPGNRKYQYVRVGGDTYAGSSLLASPLSKKPTYLVGSLSGDLKDYDSVITTPDLVLWKLRPSVLPEQNN